MQVRERELVAGEIALVAKNLLERLATRASFRERFCKVPLVGLNPFRRSYDAREEHAPDHRPVAIRVHDPDSLVHARPRVRVVRLQPRSGERFVHVASDCTGLVKSEAVVSESGNAAERLTCKML